MTDQCIWCFRFVRTGELWCNDCAPIEYCHWTIDGPPTCAPMRLKDGSFGVCCMVEARLEKLGLDPYLFDISLREQYTNLKASQT